MSDPDAHVDCRRAHEWLSEQMERPLDPDRAARLQRHLALCEFCRRMERQMEMLRRAMRRLGE